MRYKFRAECKHDLDELHKLLFSNNIDCENYRIIYTNLPDCVVTIETDVDIEKIKEFMNSVIDGHVMAETLKPENEYNGEREYDTETANCTLCAKVKSSGFYTGCMCKDLGPQNGWDCDGDGNLTRCGDTESELKRLVVKYNDNTT